MLGLVKQKIEAPFSVLIYGVEGAGKTEFGAESPDPVFLGSESGSNKYELYRFPKPKVWADVMRDLKRLENEPHDRKTVVIDSLDWLEPLVFAEVVRVEGKGKTIDSSYGGFDRGKIVSVQHWREMMDQLEILRSKRKMNIILIAHADATKFKDPALQTDYLRYAPKLFKQSSAYLKEAVDAVLFMNFLSIEDAEGKVTSQGVRYTYTEHRAGWDAKNRYNMPHRIDTRFAEFYKYASPEPMEAIMKRIDDLAPRLTEERQAALRAGIAKAGSDRTKILAIEKALTSEVSKLSKEAS